MSKQRPRVAVALSGGVDSAVSAKLLQDAGFGVTGIFMKTYEPEDSYADECTWKEDQKSAQAVAKHLHIPFVTWNFEREYSDTVLRYFFKELEEGRTPNPDIMCNQDIKFGCFLERAIKEDFVYIATGHYAQLTCSVKGFYELRRGVDMKKDQSYFLCRVPQKTLSKVLFPIGHLTKESVRKLAKSFHLPNADRKDSQGICFIGKIDVPTFIARHIKLKSGKIRTIEGQVVGTHNGLGLYTIGQREGIRIGGTPEPYYVVDKDLENNTLLVAQGKENSALFSSGCILKDLVWVGPARDFMNPCFVQIRHQQEPQRAIITEQSMGNLEVKFKDPQRAVTPGQLCAIYEDHICVASGIISSRVA